MTPTRTRTSRLVSRGGSLWKCPEMTSRPASHDERHGAGCVNTEAAQPEPDLTTSTRPPADAPAGTEDVAVFLVRTDEGDTYARPEPGLSEQGDTVHQREDTFTKRSVVNGSSTSRS